MKTFFEKGLSDEDVAWAMTDKLVKNAQDVFTDVWADTRGDDGWVSFETGPAARRQGPEEEHRGAHGRVHQARQEVVGRAQEPDDQGARHTGGLGAIEELVASGVAVNITLIFSERSTKLARDAV